MADYGMICEWNPLHLGHVRLLEYARRLGADRIVCVMSGNTVQRGEFAIADRYLRAEAAIRCGVDLVLELPFPWCSGSAEVFARGGISILRHFADRLVFGSECGSVETLRKAAQIAATEEFRSFYRESLEEGIPAAKAYCDALSRWGAEELSSNDLLGVEYLRAIQDLDAGMGADTFKREGAAYRQTRMGGEAYPSASAIRSLWERGDFEGARAYLPEAAEAVYARGRVEGRFRRQGGLDEAILSYFRLHDGGDFEGIVGTEGGLAYRICRLAQSARTVDELLAALKNKRYTDAHLRRVLLFCLFGVKPTDLQGLPLYTTVLGASEQGRALLREMGKCLPDPCFLVTKPADAPESRQSVLARRVDGIFTLSTERTSPAFDLMKRKPYLG
ncbi:MAG: nucleotidyltransferase family protein [Clostridia bacterium]|nr:nucleotidyltransferase family protein [Clostridia bacterium]